MKKLLILACSDRNNLKLSENISVLAEKKNFETDIVNLSELNLPLYTNTQDSLGPQESATALKEKFISSDALFFVAPEYNGGVPPLFNNTLAWISRTGKDWREAFNGKTTAIASHSGGGGVHVLMAMRAQLAYVGANVIGRQIQVNANRPINADSINACLSQL